MSKSHDTLLDFAATLFGTTPRDICSPSRYAWHINARFAVAFVMRMRDHMGYREIAGVLGGRDHATVHNAVRAAGNMLLRDDAYRNVVRALWDHNPRTLDDVLEGLS